MYQHALAAVFICLSFKHCNRQRYTAWPIVFGHSGVGIGKGKAVKGKH